MAVPSSTKITLVNTDASTIYVDYTNVDSAKSKVQKDLKNIIAELDAIKKAYNELAKQKTTKGTWQSLLTGDRKQPGMVNVCKKYHNNFNTLSNSMDSYITSSVLQYVLSMIQELKNAQNVAANIQTDAGTMQK